MAPNVQLVKDCDNYKVSTDLSGEQIAILKRMFCSKATDDEFQVFIEACNRTKLDPFMRQIYLLKFGNVVNVMVGIDGLRLLAERTGKYMPGREPTYTYTKDGQLFSATAYVKKKAPDGSWHECAATAHFAEYKGSNVWNSKPHVMLAKCAESLVLRKAFPADMSGIYTEDEMDQVKMNARDAIDISACEKADPVSIKPVTVFPEKEAVNIDNRAPFKDTQELENEIDHFITPHDAEYKAKLLEFFGVKFIHQMTSDNVAKARKSVAKKVLDIKEKERMNGIVTDINSPEFPL